MHKTTTAPRPPTSLRAMTPHHTEASNEPAPAAKGAIPPLPRRDSIPSIPTSATTLKAARASEAPRPSRPRASSVPPPLPSLSRAPSVPPSVPKLASPSSPPPRAASLISHARISVPPPLPPSATPARHSIEARVDTPSPASTGAEEPSRAIVVVEQAPPAKLGDAMAQLYLAIATLRKQVEDLERRAQLVAERLETPPAIVAAIAAATPRSTPPPPLDFVDAAPAPIALDARLDGHRRRVRAAAMLALVIVFVFGSLLGTLALSRA
jgi:hypothetical protein